MRNYLFLGLFYLVALPLLSQKPILIESGIVLSWVQSFSEQGSRIMKVKFETRDPYECSNYPLINTQAIEENKIVITIKGVDQSVTCDNKMGSATAYFDFSGFALGEYSMNVWVNKQLFKCDISLSSLFYGFVTNADPDLLFMKNSKMYLIPVNTVWGKLEYSEASMKEVAEMFFVDLKKEGCANTLLEAGSYGDFFLHELGITTEKGLGGGKFEFPFVFSYSGDPGRLKLLVDMYGNKYGDKLKLILNHTSGKKYSAGK